MDQTVHTFADAFLLLLILMFFADADACICADADADAEHICADAWTMYTSVLMLRQTLIKLVESQLALARRLTNFTVIAIYEF